jgi:hypothetical protein
MQAEADAPPADAPAPGAQAKADVPPSDAPAPSPQAEADAPPTPSAQAEANAQAPAPDAPPAPNAGFVLQDAPAAAPLESPELRRVPSPPLAAAGRAVAATDAGAPREKKDASSPRKRHGMAAAADGPIETLTYRDPFAGVYKKCAGRWGLWERVLTCRAQVHLQRGWEVSSGRHDGRRHV